MSRHLIFCLPAVALCLAFAPAPAPKDLVPVAPPEKPESLLVLGCDKLFRHDSHSLGWAWDRKSKNPPLLFKRRSRVVGELHAYASSRKHPGRNYYLCANRFEVIQEDGNGEMVLFKHTTYVRDLGLDEEDNVHFSEATGAGGDGKIYRIKPGKGRGGATAELVCTVPIRDLGGFWAGNFAFGRTEKGALDTSTLYLSSGNMIPSSLYRMTRKNGSWGKPERLFGATTTIMGLVVTSPNELYYVSDKQVLRLTDFKTLKSVLTLPDAARLWRISLIPNPPGRKAR
jgi:hypothetical protein